MTGIVVDGWQVDPHSSATSQKGRDPEYCPAQVEKLLAQAILQDRQ
jgi:hypothetical protein